MRVIKSICEYNFNIIVFMPQFLCQSGSVISAFRFHDIILAVVISLIIVAYSEPIGSSKPKFSEDINSKGITREQSKETTLVCPAQSFPLPSFRLVNKT